MLATWEVRWFCAGEPDAAAVALFPEFDWHDIGKREDIYVRLSDSTDLGIKHREGRFEVKGRRLVVPNVQFAPGATGHLEQWVKWTSDGAELEPLFQRATDEMDLGIRVRKQRIQRQFRLGDLPEEVAGDRNPGRGSNLELTRLEVRGQRWWSLGIEAFPDDSEVPGQVVQLAVDLFGDALQLSGERSKSYPAWLAQFVTEGF